MDPQELTAFVLHADQPTVAGFFGREQRVRFTQVAALRLKHLFAELEFGFGVSVF